MHPLHDYIANQIGEKIKSRRIVVMYDSRGELIPFFDELSHAPAPGDVAVGKFGSRDAKLIRFDGSFLQVREAAEPFAGADDVDDVVVYLPGVTRDDKGSLLLELEKAGIYYAQPALKSMARNVLRKRYTDVAIDKMLQSEALTYSDLAKMASDTGAAEGASVLRSIFGTTDTEALIADWLISSHHDADITTKGAIDELRRTVKTKIDLDLPQTDDLGRLRGNAARYVLANEFRLDLTGTAPATLSSIAVPSSGEQENAVRGISIRLRDPRHAEEYEGLADRIESELGLDDASVPGSDLGSIDTFRFEERAVVRECFRLIAAGNSKGANALLERRVRSFWVERDASRKAVWEACRLMLEMDALVQRVESTLSKANGRPEKWVERYTAVGADEAGWYRLDQAQRQLETLLAAIDDADLDERAVARIRGRYDGVARKMAEGFIKVFAAADWTIPGYLHQTRIWSDVIANRHRPTAVVIVDAMRYEIGVELGDRLEKLGEVKLLPAIAVLPSITPVGMAALLPGASASFSIVEKNGRFGAAIDGSFLPNLDARQKFLKARIPGAVDVTLDEVVTWSSATKKKLVDAQVVIVRSSEIDGAGENVGNRYARSLMSGVVSDIARSLQKLASVGIEDFVITADHGHLFFGAEREESMRIDNPTGDQVELHRRCWIGRGGATPPGSIRVAGAKLGYDTDLDIVLPASVAVFKSGGDLAYHHGGASLQELVIPLLTVRLQATGQRKGEKNLVGVKLGSDAVTNRIFSVEISLGAGLFAEAKRVRPMAISEDREVASAKMTASGLIEGGIVNLQPGAIINVAFLLTDDEVKSLKIQVLDAETDAVLYTSPSAIPVRLGV